MRNPARFFSTLTLLLLSTVNFVGASDAHSPDFAQCFTKTLARLEKNDYNTERGLRAYDHGFVSMLLPKLQAVAQKNGHWLDAGAGQGRAIISFVRLQRSQGKPIPKITALAYRVDPKAAQAYRDLSQKVGDQKLRLLQDRFVEDIPAQEIGPTDLITDVYGPFAYTDRLDKLLNHYLELLNPDGAAMITYEQAKTTIIRTRSGESVSVLKWLESLSHKNLLKVERGFDEYGENDHVVMTRLSTKKINVPRLELVYLKDGAPPRRVFLEEGAHLGEEEMESILKGFEPQGYQ